MNTISAVTPTQVQNPTPVNAQKQNHVNFTGNLGDKFVRQVINGTDIDPKAILSEAKGTFGLKSEKVEDIMESFIGKVKELFSDNMKLQGKLNDAERKIYNFPDEKQQAINETTTRLQRDFQQVIAGKNQELAAKDKEIAKVKEEFAKYEPVVKIKSVEELDTILPDEAAKILDEMVAHRIEARKSMFDFLMTGKGQEEAFAQIERNNQIQKARQDGMFNIPELKTKLNTITQQENLYTSSDTYFTIQMIQKALVGHPQGAYLNSRVIEEQVKNNAMAILTPMADNRYYNTNIQSIEKELDQALDNVKKYHTNFTRGMEKLKKQNPKAKFEITQVDFDADKSKVKITTDDYSVEHSFYDINFLGSTQSW